MHAEVEDAPPSTLATLACRRLVTPAEAPLVTVPPSATCRASVVIPARNEAATITRTLTALAEQRSFTGRPLPPDTYEIILLANNCQDDTARAARLLAHQYPHVALHVVETTLPSAVAHVGTARRLAMDEACERLLRCGQQRGIVATTDADTLVSPTWLAATMREVERGAEAIGGRVQLRTDELQAMPLHLRRRYLRDAGYNVLVDAVMARIDPCPGNPWPRHHQFLGASIAVTAYAYRRIGGLPPLPSSEDVALGRALRRADIEIRHSPDVRVHTSGRLYGRAAGGMAEQLAVWSALPDDAQTQYVLSAGAVLARATVRRTLREQWRAVQAGHPLGARAMMEAARIIGAKEQWLRAVIHESETFGALLDTVEEQATWPRHGRPVDIRTAIADLRVWLAQHGRDSRSSPVPVPVPVSARQPRSLLSRRPAQAVLRSAARPSGPALPVAYDEIEPIRLIPA